MNRRRRQQLQCRRRGTAQLVSGRGLQTEDGERIARRGQIDPSAEPFDDLAQAHLQPDPAFAHELGIRVVVRRRDVAYGNDHDLTPSRVLSGAMRDAGKPFQLKIYPRYGSSADQGHALGYFGAEVWSADVFRFLDAHCR